LVFGSAWLDLVPPFWMLLL